MYLLLTFLAKILLLLLSVEVGRYLDRLVWILLVSRIKVLLVQFHKVEITDDSV